jgi:dipeptidyl aminopeptidase/acylaminoacyl peptidase
LVFKPDLYFEKNLWGPSALNSIEGAVKRLSEFPFVDKYRIGLVGHSNSGNTGYYILTHSKSFAAMAVGAANTNRISGTLTLGRFAEGEIYPLKSSELNFLGMGLGNLWSNKEKWLDHTAALNANRVVSPVLLFHNKGDGVFVEQAVEMFLSLYRLKKPAWWLQYDDGDHVLHLLKDKIDFTIRYTQFFDHYLKGAVAPRWMTYGIEASRKGIDSGYTLDPSGRCNDKCKICNTWSKKFRSNPNYFQRPLIEW